MPDNHQVDPEGGIIENLIDQTRYRVYQDEMIADPYIVREERRGYRRELQEQRNHLIDNLLIQILELFSQFSRFTYMSHYNRNQVDNSLRDAYRLLMQLTSLNHTSEGTSPPEAGPPEAGPREDGNYFYIQDRTNNQLEEEYFRRRDEDSRTSSEPQEEGPEGAD